MDPYYQDESVTLYHGDCLEVLPALSGAHLVLTDPPYFRVVDEEWDDQWGPNVAAFLDWLGGVLELCEAAAEDRATFAVFASPDQACGVEVEMRKRLHVLNHVVWRKTSPGWLGQSMNNLRRFFPLSERLLIAEKARNPDGDLWRFRDHVNHQVAAEVYADIRVRLVEWRDAAGVSNRDVDTLLGTNGMAGHYFGASQWALPKADHWGRLAELFRSRGVDVPDYAELRSEFDARRSEFDARRSEFDARRREFDARPNWELCSDVWTFNPVRPGPKRLHPCQKPEPLIAHIIETCSRPGDVVLDPFAGSGTTLAVASQLGRKAIGVEKDADYCEKIVARLGAPALPLGGVA